MRARAWLAVVALALTGLCAGPAFATPAQTLKQQGDALLDALRYEEALAKYEASFAIVADPAVLYNQGRCHEELGHYPEAVSAYERFLRQATPELKAKAPGLAALVAKLRGKIARLLVRSNVGGAKIRFRDRLVGVTPLAAPIELPEGQGTLELYADGYEVARQPLALGGGTVKTLDLSLRRLLKPREAPATSLASRWWFWTAIAGAVAGGIAVTLAATTERGAERGNYGPGQVAAPLRVAW